jgi:DNA (cytosine-5)-methyltransferase 1
MDSLEYYGSSWMLANFIFLEPSFSSNSLQTATPASTPTQSSRQATLAGQEATQYQDKGLTSKSRISSNVPPFRSLNWTPRTPKAGTMTPISPPMSGQDSRFSSTDCRRLDREKSRTLSLSPTPESRMLKRMVGTADQPIDLLANERSEVGKQNLSECRTRKNQSESSGSYSYVPKYGGSQHPQYIWLDDDDKDGEELSNALARSLRRLPTADDELIDLEEIEDELLQADGQIMQIEDAYLGDARQQPGRRKSSRAEKFEARNSAIILPFLRQETLKFLGRTIKQNKTVELRDGGFLRIKDIILNAETEEVKLRGHRLQRARDMNGMLPKKMNEFLLFLEVDNDDARDPLEQAVVEATLADIVQLRSVRYTNENFPINRNMDPKEFADKDVALETGGLTARWKYTCRYADATNRYHNRFQERSLERLGIDECSKGYSAADQTRRMKWRGETVLGGAYQPSIDREDALFLPESREGSIISIKDSEAEDQFALMHVYSIDDSSSDDGDDLQTSKKSHSRLNMTKRKHSKVTTSSLGQASGGERGRKKMRAMELGSVKETREGLSIMNLQPDKKRGSKTKSKITDLSPTLSRSIDLTLSDLATPPDTGSIRIKSQISVPRVRRTAGQQLTYGDGFSGAGGSTRGAAMAGLRVRWGFDFWKQACETWEANFPYARCFNRAAHEFVDFAKRNPHSVKVDILHLSPPCQFFSPAHTINGVDDEMNTASLFAVEAVIKVTRPRIVTLEQTFGITHPRFRFYFNALIQMFTSHDFSIRWAVIPLAQWVRF